ncbi:MAG: YcaO-like family protein [Rhizobiales bacterium]|nr:YcaO-like family protein [Hyphomicrobiales bacterium]
MSLNASRDSGEPAPAAGRPRRPADTRLPAAAFAAVMEIDGAHERPVSSDHDRCLTPQATLERIRPHLASLGITRLGEITGLDSLGIPVALATRPNSFSLSVNLGKGRDAASARASAAMEAAEIAVAERLPEDVIIGSLSEMALSGRAALDLGRIARCQPHRLDPDEPLLWVRGYSLFSGEAVMVPWALVGLDHRPAAPGYHDAFEVATDGLASGNLVAEAVLHGLCELVERDAYAQLELMPAHKLNARRRGIQAAGPQLGGLLELIARRGLELRLFEMTSDIAIPAYFAILSQGERDAGEFYSWSSLCGGCGCHPSPERAIIRAVTEAAQARIAMAAGARDDLPPSHYQPGDRFMGKTAQDMFGAAMRIDGAGAQRDMPAWVTTNFGERILHVLGALARVGIDEAIVVELASGPLEARVARVIVPDLQIPLHGERTQVLSRALRHLLEAAR